MDAQPPETAFELFIRSTNFLFECLSAKSNYRKREFMVLEVTMEYCLAMSFFISAVLWLSALHPMALVLCFLIFFYYVRSVFMFFCRYRESVVRVNELHHYSQRMMRCMDFHRSLVAEDLPISGTGGGAAYLGIGIAVFFMLVFQAATVGLLVAGLSQ